MNFQLADDFVITIEDGSTFSKPGYIAHNDDARSARRSFGPVRPEGPNLLYGNVAVVTGADHEQGLEKGKPCEYHDRFTDVRMNLKSRLQVIASQYGLRPNQ